MRQVDNFPGLWIGPADAKPPEDPRLIWVRGSKVSLTDPAAIVANIKANDAAHPEWSAPRVEARTVGGVELRAGADGDRHRRQGAAPASPSRCRSRPFRSTSSPPRTRAEFPKMLPLYERILFSVQPVAAANAGKK